MGNIASTYNGGLNSMTLHDFIILMTLPIGTSAHNTNHSPDRNIGVQYEIYKLIHYEVTNTLITLPLD